MLAFIVTITGRSICSASSHCDNNEKKGRSICSANNYCDNNGEVYVHC